MNTVLVVEDDPAIREMVRLALESAGFAVFEAGNAVEARHLLASSDPDIVLMDWMLPGGQSGYELTQSLRKDPAGNDVPVIMLTARDSEQDKVAALEAGADDYLSKPFSVRELVARIRAILRRSSPSGNSEVLEFEGLEIDQSSHRARANDGQLRLSPAEYQLLVFFMRHPERVYSRAQLIDRVWGAEADIEERTVDVHIRRLRKLLEPTGHDTLIQTVRGSGYRFSGTA